SSCQLRWKSRTVSQGDPDPAFVAAASRAGTAWSSPPTFKPGYADQTSWAVAECPENALAKRLLCAVPSVGAPAQAASDDLATGLPRPKPWVLTTGKNSPFIKSVHLETPLSLEGTLDFYRTELTKRGWTQNAGAVVAPDRAVIEFTTSDGPALL